MKYTSSQDLTVNTKVQLIYNSFKLEKPLVIFRIPDYRIDRERFNVETENTVLNIHAYTYIFMYQYINNLFNIKYNRIKNLSNKIKSDVNNIIVDKDRSTY